MITEPATPSAHAPLAVADLIDIASALGVHVTTAPLTHGRDGEYIHALRMIRLRPSMGPRLGRTVLAHEIAHAVHGDEQTADVAASVAQEWRAETWAARRLITVPAYLTALERHERRSLPMAHELGVTASLVAVFGRIIDQPAIEHDWTAATSIPTDLRRTPWR